MTLQITCGAAVAQLFQQVADGAIADDEHMDTNKTKRDWIEKRKAKLLASALCDQRLGTEKVVLALAAVTFDEAFLQLVTAIGRLGGITASEINLETIHDELHEVGFALASVARQIGPLCAPETLALDLGGYLVDSDVQAIRDAAAARRGATEVAEHTLELVDRIKQGQRRRRPKASHA